MTSIAWSRRVDYVGIDEEVREEFECPGSNTFEDISLIDGEVAEDPAVVSLDADDGGAGDREGIGGVRLRGSHAGAVADHVGGRVAEALV